MKNPHSFDYYLGLYGINPKTPRALNTYKIML